MSKKPTKPTKSTKSRPSNTRKSSKSLFSLNARNLIIYVIIFGIIGAVFIQFSRANTNNGIWVDRTQLMSLPTSGEAWNSITTSVNKLPADGSGADISNQDSNHDQYTLAAALACARTSNTTYCTKARGAINSSIGSEVTTLTTPRSPASNQWLPVGRNLGAYVIAADVMNLRSDSDPNSLGSRFQTWIATFKGRKGSEGAEFRPFQSGSNADAQMGFVYSSVASYLNDSTMLTRAWDAFRTYAGDPTAPDKENINITNAIEGNWTAASSKPGATAIAQKGTTKNGVRLDGADGNDMVRGGAWAAVPGHSQYPWVGLEGFVPAALILHRAGYPAFEVADQAVKRTADYLWYLHKNVDAYWWDAEDVGRAAEVKHIMNTYYGLNYTVVYPTGEGRTVGFTDWTHPTKSAIDATIVAPPPPPSDTGLPITSITSPLNGESKSGSITVTANASDNVGVTKVELYRNNQLVDLDAAAPYEFAWDSTTVANGSYSLSTRAYDAVGNVGNSATITITINNATVVLDTQAPSVTISSPTDGVKVSGKVNIAGSATDNVKVTSMQIIVDGKTVASSGSGSVSATWNTRAQGVAKGAHTITVRATDGAGNFAEKTITVYK